MNTIKENSKVAFNQQAATYDKELRASTPALFIPSCWKSCRTFRFNLPSIWDAGLVKC